MTDTAVLAIADGGMDLMEEQMKMAKVLAASDLLPNLYRGKPANVLLALRRASKLNVDPQFFMENTAVINGKLVMHSDGPLAIVRARAGSDLERFHEEWDEQSKTAICTAKRRGQEPVVRSFSFDEAKHAGLLDKAGPWKQFPKRMCQMRARSYTLRDGFGDYLGGIRQAEEFAGEDLQPADFNEIPAEKPSAADTLRAAVAKQNEEPKAPEPTPAEKAAEVVEAVADVFGAEGEERELATENAQSLFEGDEAPEQPQGNQSAAVADYPAGMRTKPAQPEQRKTIDVDAQRDALMNKVLHQTKQLHPELDGRAYAGHFSSIVGRKIGKRYDLSVADLEQILSAYEEAAR